MATRAIIIYNYNYRYNHFDGYPNCLGEVLSKHYNTEESINALFNVHRDIKSLAETLEETEFLEDVSIGGERFCYSFRQFLPDDTGDILCNHGQEFVYQWNDKQRKWVCFAVNY